MIEENNQGDRYNEGKPRFSLVSPIAHEELAKVLTMGAQKYAPYNWMKGLPYMEIIDSLERHVNAFKKGENMDKESGLHHMAHVMCNAMFLIEFIESGRDNLDDRPSAEATKSFKETKISDSYTKGFKAGQEFEKARIKYNKLERKEDRVDNWNGHFFGGPVPKHYTTTTYSDSNIALLGDLNEPDTEYDGR